MSSTPSAKGNAASHEEEVKRAAEIREWLEEKISELELEVSRLREMQIIVDNTLRRSSFIPATQLREEAAPEQKQTAKTAPSEAVAARVQKPVASKKEAPLAAKEEGGESRQLRRTSDGMPLANVSIDQSTITIVPTSGVKVAPTTPPFQSFFLNRILNGYQSKDAEAAKSGSLTQSQVISYDVEVSPDGLIARVVIRNYRDKARLNEILSTLTWAFTRMLEKK